MIYRTKEAGLILEAVSCYIDKMKGFDVTDWTENDNNVALTDGQNVALFSVQYAGVVHGHYFFEAKGKDAIRLGREMLKEAFEGPYNIQVIMGLTPLEHLGARWMNKQLGFKSEGPVKTDVGPHELVILTKPQWESTNE